MAKPETNEIAGIPQDIDIFLGWMQRIENPDPVLRTESGGRGLKLYDEVARDAHANAVLSNRYMALSGCEWEVLAAASPAKKGRPGPVTREQQIAEFVNQVLLSCNFSQAIQELSQAILYGFYVAEILWKIDAGGSVGIKRIVTKHPRRFSFTALRELRLLTFSNMVEGVALPDKKFVVFTWGSSDNPFGCGLGQKLWWPVWFKKSGIKFWMIMLEKFGMPTIKGLYPPGTDAASQQKLMDAIEAFQTDSGVIIPDTMQLELLEATRTGNVSYQDLLDYMDRAISKCVLGQTLTTEVKAGSLAASKTHNEIRNEIIKSDADILVDTLNATLIKWIVDYNFDGVTDYPKLWFRTEPGEDLFQLAQRDKILVVDCGLSIAKRYFYDTYSIPEPESGEELVAPAPPVAPINPVQSGLNQAKPGQDGKPAAAFSETSALNLFPDQTAIDAMQPPAGKVLTETLKPVIDLIQKGYSYQEVEDNLTKLWPEMKIAEIEKLMERAIFVSEVWGRLNA